jgi:hypothetical protein
MMRSLKMITATVTLPEAFTRYMDATPLVEGQRADNADDQALLDAYATGKPVQNTRSVSLKITTGSVPALRALIEQAEMCVEINVDEYDRAPQARAESDAASKVATRARTALAKLRTALKAQQAEQDAQQAAQAEQDAADMVTELRYERRTGGDGTAEFSSSTERLVWVRREVASALRQGRKVTKNNSDGLIKIEGGNESTVRLLPLPDEAADGFDAQDPPDGTNLSAAYEARHPQRETTEAQMIAATPRTTPAAPADQGAPILVEVVWMNAEDDRLTGMIQLGIGTREDSAAVEASGKQDQAHITGGRRRATIDAFSDYDPADAWTLERVTPAQAARHLVDWLGFTGRPVTVKVIDETR